PARPRPHRRAGTVRAPAVCCASTGAQSPSGSLPGRRVTGHGWCWVPGRFSPRWRATRRGSWGSRSRRSADMLKATVVGNVWSTKRVEGLPNGAFLEVEVEGGSRLVAFDVLGSGMGERVLVATGSVAAAYFPDPHP